MPPDTTPSGWAHESVETVLRRRGHVVAATGDVRQTLFPQERLEDVLRAYREAEGSERFERVLGSDPWRRYVEWFNHAAFRKVVRLLIDASHQPVSFDVLRQTAGKNALVYAEYLSALGVVACTDTDARLTRPLDNFGPSFEHYVCVLCTRELRGQAEWGVKLKGLPKAGGDYDVLAWLPPILVYIECKAGNPLHIEETQLRHFLQRAEELTPELSILLVDTDVDLTEDVTVADETRPSLISRLNRIIWEAHGAHEQADRSPIKPERDYPGVSSSGHLYVTNTRKNVLSQLRRCLQHYHVFVKGAAFFAREKLTDYLTRRGPAE